MRSGKRSSFIGKSAILSGVELQNANILKRLDRKIFYFLHANILLRISRYTFGKMSVRERADYYECDLPGCHMRFMIQEQAREGGIYFLAVGAACWFSLIARTHYA